MYVTPLSRATDPRRTRNRPSEQTTDFFLSTGYILPELHTRITATIRRKLCRRVWKFPVAHSRVRVQLGSLRTP